MSKNLKSESAVASHSGVYQPLLGVDDAVSPVSPEREQLEELRPARRTRVERLPGLSVLSVAAHSPLFAYVRPGDFLISINDEPVADTIDFHFKMADDETDLVFQDQSGEQLLFEFDGVTVDELGVTFDQGGIRTCNNGCIFCFVMQQPKGMRRSLYIMDEDYRYSFTHGNFVTLSNTSDADIERIIEQRLSPLYISVHATNDTLRRCMLRNERLEPILPRIRRLVEGGITIHTQVVVCPGVNDGVELERTIHELVELHPGVATLALAPVGLTKYRDNLPELALYGPAAAGELIDRIEALQRELLNSHGTRFVWAADEFYTSARRTFPSLASYEELEQFENGVGMCRSLLTNFNRRRKGIARRLESLAGKAPRMIALTGVSAQPWLEAEVGSWLRGAGAAIEFHAVDNQFWGGSVTVSGLLTGADLLGAAQRIAGADDVVLLPPNCLNNDDLFLDNKTLAQFRERVGARVVVGSYDITDTILEALDPSAPVERGSGDRRVALTEAV
ncbi:MAG TPA: DUF512 domain-containing protein [candidate division Zixibacteria bacterium]|nr:DUF512 domain-containing protein [candidate division Zixibacteria bacterium]